MYMQTIYLYCTMCMSLKTSCTSMTPDVCIEMTFNTFKLSFLQIHGSMDGIGPELSMAGWLFRRLE